MTRKQTQTLSLIGVLTLTLALGACGRAGGLESPGGSGGTLRGPGGSLEDAVIGYNGTTPDGAVKPSRKFFLDPLL
ncbi:MAG: hypothetical protein COA52_07280 [Hyphomicrobiales bacterium]|nr:hypothetical protein [Hyphomicrobiales bacterium]PCJ92751.1 MAG: hypothetical protein COA52_07280 [Hyphomicrobiales bacterium]